MSLTTYPKVDQGTEAWHDLRRGMVTASVIGSLLTTEKPDATEFTCPNCGIRDGLPCLSLHTNQPIKSIHEGRQKLASAQEGRLVVANNDTSRGLTALLVAERLTGFTEPTWMNDDMFRGVADEPIARDIYSGHYSQAVEVGFMVRDDWGFELGYSPDGLVGTDGLIEIKSRRQKKQLQTILADKVPAENMAQLQCGLLVSGRSWIDYVSYCGGMPLYVKRVEPDAAWFEVIVAAAQALEDNAAQIVATYRTATKGLPNTERILDLEMSL